MENRRGHLSKYYRQWKVIISGMGKAGQIGMNIATTLTLTGTPVAFIHPSEAQPWRFGFNSKK